MNIKRSLELQQKAKRIIPGMSQLLSKRPDMFSLGVWPGYYERAQGAHVWDLDGNKYLDMSIAGIGANVLGYADEDVNAAVKAAIDKGSSSTLNCPEEVELAQEMCRLHPWAEMARFTRSGGEAMAVAIRIVRAFKGKDKIAFCGYHGWHDWYLAANLGTENALGEHLIPGLSPMGVPQGLKGTAVPFSYNDLESLKKVIEANKNDLAAIVMEPVRSTQPAKGFLKGVRELADKSKLVLVFDEISAGFRLNTGGAHLIYGIEPDIAVFSKALGNGFPIAAIIGKNEVMEAAQTSFISSTMWTERVGFVAALATIRKHEKVNAGAHLIKIGRRVQEGWKSLASKHGLKLNISGIEPLSHFTFGQGDQSVMKAYFIQEMLKKGFLASNLYYSMWAHTEDHVKEYLQAVDEVFAAIRTIEGENGWNKALAGKPAASGFKRVA